MRTSQLLAMVDHCIELCEKEKERCYSGEATKEQVEEYILPELKELRQKILENDLPQNRFLTAFGYAFRCWDWSMQNASALYIALKDLHEAYQVSGIQGNNPSA